MLQSRFLNSYFYWVCNQHVFNLTKTLFSDKFMFECNFDFGIIWASMYFVLRRNLCLGREYYRGKYHCTIDLLFDWCGISCMTTDNFCFYLQNRLILTSQTGGQWYSDTSPLSFPWLGYKLHLGVIKEGVTYACV